MDWVKRQSRRLATTVLRSGAIPKHVAFIMDGNRRYARKINVETIKGHAAGFETLKQTLEWCMDLGVEVVTVYAFSLENFNRSEIEVNGLMALAEEKFYELLKENEMIQRLGVQIRVLGDVARLPQGLQKAISEVMTSSKNNYKAILNVCFAYTARDEIATAAMELVRGLKDGVLVEEDVTEELLSQTLYTAELPPPDLVIRSSGEVRLSDFLLWQSGYSLLVFAPVLWPEFSFYDLFKCFLQYQNYYKQLKEVLDRKEKQEKKASSESEKRQQAAITNIIQQRWRLFQSQAQK
eukprot:m.71171 g.71171  ORF g.71171 m.71171 type:complete len:294 (-) comp8338_c3_seq7:3540-4421(-)